MVAGRRHADEIVAALERLGCIVYAKDEDYYWVARANVRMQMVRRWWIPASQERSIVEKLDHNMVDYMAAIRANQEAAISGPGGAHLVAAKPEEEEEPE